MPFPADNSEESAHQLLGLIKESIEINSHFEFFLWMQGRIQKYLPHEVMIAAWGDFTLGVIYYDIVSAIPGIRTNLLADLEMVPFLKRFYAYWIKHDMTPFQLIADRSVIRCRDIEDPQLKLELQNMKSALIHAIKDTRGGNDCLYVLLSIKPDIQSETRIALQNLLPYIDAALRQIEHLPEQLPNGLIGSKEELSSVVSDKNEYSLSLREIGIMNLVGLGKTNVEIGNILNISSFTVKNHLKHIFKKLDVLNRSQAVAKFRANTKG
jgi:transcriptional regulator EpsA